MTRLYDLLPLVIRLKDAEASGAGGLEPILARITDRLLQDEHDAHTASLLQMKQLYNCLQVDNPYRSLLLQFVDQKVADGWSETLERFFLCEAVPWHKISGMRFAWWKAFEYRAASAFDFYELFKTEPKEIADYAPSRNAMFPFRAARVALTPAGLSPYDWSTDTIICVEPYIPRPPVPPLPVDYDVGSTDLTAGLLGHWPLEEGPTENRKPSNGVVALEFQDVGGVAVQQDKKGIFNKAAKWNDPVVIEESVPSTGERLKLTNTILNFGVAQSFTIHLWLKKPDAVLGAIRTVFYKQDGLNAGASDPFERSGYHLYTEEINSQFTLWFRVNTPSGGVVVHTLLSKYLNTNRFYSVVCWWDVRDGKAYIQIDDDVPTSSTSTIVSPSGGTGPLVLGNGAPTRSQWRGLEDSLSIWDRTLTIAERQELFDLKGADPAAGLFPPPSPLLSFHQKIVSPQRGEDQLFAGDSVAINEDNGWMFLSAPRETLVIQGTGPSDPNYIYPQAGRVYGYQKSSTSEDSWTNTWTFDDPRQPFPVGLPDPGGRFGTSIAASKNWLFIGATDRISVFRRINRVLASGANPQDTWVWVETLTPPDLASADYGLGSMHVEGDTLVVGDLTAQANGKPNSGRVHVYTYDAAATPVVETFGDGNQDLTLGSWATGVVVPVILIPVGLNYHNAGDNFGVNVSLSGNMIAVGACYNHYDKHGKNFLTNAGAAYTFVQQGTTWVQHQKITARRRRVDARFGSSIVVDTGIMVVGASGERLDATEQNTIDGAGAAYLFTNTELPYGELSIPPGDTLEFREIQKLVASDRQDTGVSALFGTTIALEDDILLIGAKQESMDVDGLMFANTAGAVYAFTLMYAYNPNFAQTQKITGVGVNGRLPGDKFGSALAIDGRIIVVGAPGQNWDENGLNEIPDGSEDGTGAAYIFGTSVFTPAVPPGAIDFGPIVCQDFAVLPVGGLDTVWGANDSTSVLIAENLFPPQPVEAPPDTFNGPYDMLMVRFRARSTSAFPVALRINNTLVGADRVVTVPEGLVQEYEVSWTGFWPTIDWSMLWASFSTGKETWTVEVTAVEFIVRQREDVTDETEVTYYTHHTTISGIQVPAHGGISRLSGITFFGDVGVGVEQQFEAIPWVVNDGWMMFQPGALLEDGTINPPAIPKGSNILYAKISGLGRAEQVPTNDFSDVPAFIQGNIAQQQVGFPDALPDKTEATSIWLIPIHPSTDPGYPPGDENTLSFPHIIQEIIDDPIWLDDDTWPFLLMIRSQHPGATPPLDKRVVNAVNWTQITFNPSFNFHPMAKLTIRYGPDSGTPTPESCLQACECVCQTGCEVACQVASETDSCITACENQCQTGCQITNQSGAFSLPPEQDTDPCLQFELEGCIEINRCLGNTIPFLQALAILDEFLFDQRPIHVLPVYCVTEFDFSEQICGPGEDLFGKVIGKFNDPMQIIRDDLVIVPDCTQGCQVSCETFCEVGCEDNCQGIGPCENSCQLNCEANCQLDCEVICQQGCVISCQFDACQSFCQGQCQASCQIACENFCQGACEIAGCQLSCTSGCEDFCELDCQNSCELDCQSPAEIACQTSCQEFCEVCCQDACEGIGCQTICELVCQASCVSGCELPCETNCQTACEAGCQSTCEFNCQADCEGVGCEVGCEGGCEGGCQGSCEVTCEGASCQMACEDDGCQSCCECQCQSMGCEESCTEGCTEGCQTGCEADCQDSGGCETACQMSCEGSTEACTDCCEICCEEYTEYAQCQTGCEVDCQSACQDNCQAECETQCQTVCEAQACEVVCQTPCESTCQAACTSVTEGCSGGVEGCGFIEGIA